VDELKSHFTSIACGAGTHTEFLTGIARPLFGLIGIICYANQRINRERMSFGEIITEARKKLGISQKELAARIKKEDGEPISPQYLNDIERDRRNPPSESILVQFATELNLSKNYLILAAGSIPDELKRNLVGSDPKVIEQAFQAFRKTLKK
jgi:transcriptional regulator with XRE-family HTH domain